MLALDPISQLNMKSCPRVTREMIDKGYISKDLVQELHSAVSDRRLPFGEMPVTFSRGQNDELPIILGSALVFVGAGGTGSILISNVLQYVASVLASKPELSQPPIIIIEGDDVEPHNLVRQRFVEPDVGRNKGEVMAERYSAAFGLRIHHVNSYLTPLTDKDVRESIQKVVGTGADLNNIIFFSSVDNNLARFMVHNMASTIGGRGSNIVIDGGNGKHHGQAILSMPSRPTSLRVQFFDGKQVKKVNLSGLPFDVGSVSERARDIWTSRFFSTLFDQNPAMVNEIFEDLQITDHRLCVEQVEEDAQTLQANIASAFCMQTLYTSWCKGELNTYRINFDSASGVMEPKHVTLGDLETTFSSLSSSVALRDAEGKETFRAWTALIQRLRERIKTSEAEAKKMEASPDRDSLNSHIESMKGLISIIGNYLMVFEI